jgi:hypothetical protein
MNNKILWGFFLVVAILLITAYALNKDKQDKIIQEERDLILQQEEQRPSVTINTKYQYKDGKHVFVGLVELPTPCHTIKTKTTKEGDQTILDITTESNVEICAQVVTTKEFRITFSGNSEDSIIAKLNGELVNLNIYEVGPQQNIDEVEIFSKG